MSDLSSFNNYLDANQGDAWAYLESILSNYGLGSLTQFARDAIVQGLSNEEVVQSLRKTPEYKQRFAPILERQKMGLPPLSETDVINLERAYAQNRQSAGLPAGFYDEPSDFSQLIVNDVSPAEDQSRVLNGYVAARNAPQAVKDQIHAFYNTGLTDGELAAFFLDPQKTNDLMQRQLAAAQISGTANTTGYGALNRQQAEQLVAQGVSQQQAEQGFTQLAQESQLFNGLPGQGEQAIGQQTQLAAQFEGNAQAQQEIENRARKRVATFQQGGGYANTQTGTSVGTAQ